MSKSRFLPSAAGVFNSPPRPSFSIHTTVFSSPNTGISAPGCSSKTQGFACFDGTVPANWKPPRSIRLAGTPSKRGRLAW